jgi:hypothetical protein
MPYAVCALSAQLDDIMSCGEAARKLSSAKKCWPELQYFGRMLSLHGLVSEGETARNLITLKTK